MIGSEKGTGDMPDPSEVPPFEGALIPNTSLGVPGLVVEYRNHPVVAPLFGFAEPLSMAEVPMRDVALFVVVVGGDDGVVKEMTDPNEIPIELETIAQ